MKLSTRFSGLILDNSTGKVVGSKLAATTGHLLMSFFFIWHNFKSGFNLDQWMVYAAVVTGHKTAEKIVDLKWGNKDNANVKSNSSTVDDSN